MHSQVKRGELAEKESGHNAWHKWALQRATWKNVIKVNAKSESRCNTYCSKCGWVKVNFLIRPSIAQICSDWCLVSLKYPDFGGRSSSIPICGFVQECEWQWHVPIVLKQHFAFWYLHGSLNTFAYSCAPLYATMANCPANLRPIPSFSAR